MYHFGQIGHYLTTIIKLFDMFRIQNPLCKMDIGNLKPKLLK